MFLGEWYWPRNSGLGPESELYALLAYFPLGVTILGAVYGVARLFSMKPLASRHRAFVLGVICGSFHASVAASRFGVPVNELAFLAFVVVFAFLLRIYFEGRPNAQWP